MCFDDDITFLEKVGVDILGLFDRTDDLPLFMYVFVYLLIGREGGVFGVCVYMWVSEERGG